MSKSLSTIRTKVRTYLDEATEADWTDAEINTEINSKYMSMYTSVVNTYEDYYRTRVSTSVVADQQEYEVPDNFFKMKRLEITYISGEVRAKALRQDFDQITRSTADESIGSTSSPIYELSGNFLKFLPVPQNNVTDGILMSYIRQATELASDSSEIDIPFADRYWGIIALGAAGELLRKGQQEEEAARKYLQEFELHLEKMQRELEERYLDGSKQILDSVQDNINFENSSFV